MPSGPLSYQKFLETGPWFDCLFGFSSFFLLHRKASYSFLVGNYDIWTEEKKERKILTHETTSGMIHLTICFPHSSVSNNKLELDMRKKKTRDGERGLEIAINES